MVASRGLSTGRLPISKAFRVAISGDALLLVLTCELIMAYSSGILEGTWRRAAIFILKNFYVLIFEEVIGVNHLHFFITLCSETSTHLQQTSPIRVHFKDPIHLNLCHQTEV